jgi:hypothetical protein
MVNDFFANLDNEARRRYTRGRLILFAISARLEH